ncbi:sigma-70 family RNA polymerase sigma factor [Paenibacillus sp. MMS20-IR301]|uniref:sigma-70 family RNA polymerase sigma factor n=1 Tax=Paenibacillus sp. MMS20-IR301 TaxID=2895946 RepID=UPI0028E8F0CC|nr:sigma-70 family RNA polymerase sigma factor [Paenibacillus sp. MMS20-IR301]WNS45863.1 sigma-70 family RNA polymerase sigma factor [Paenibacillus sp. MMS20-IR301]
MTDEELRDCLQRLKEGDREAFTALHNSIKQQVFGTVTLLLGKPGDVADVVNEIYIELFRSLPQYDGKRPFRAWLNGMIVRQCSNWNRKSWRRLRIQLRSKENAAEAVFPGADTRLLAQEQRGELLQLVAELPAKLRSVIVLRYYSECSFDEIAAALDIPLGTAKSRHHKALRKLRQNAGFTEEDEQKGEWACLSKVN